MSGTVDSRVVSLQFDNSDFENRVNASLSSLKDLNDQLDRLGNNASLDGISATSRDATNGLDGIASSVSNIENRFSTLGIIGMTIIQNLTTSAMNLGASLTRNIFNGIKQGGLTRALNIQQARFQMKGLGMDVEAIMGEGGPVQNAVKGTAYGLDEAAKAASMLGSSGITDLEKLESALTGISGAAAMTGRDYSSIADIFTTVASNGQLMTQQLRQFAFSGLNVSATLVKYFKEVKGQSGVTEKAINDMVSKGKIDFETFSDAMYWAFGEHAKEAGQLFTGAMSNVKAALSRVGAKFWQPFLVTARDSLNKMIPLIDALGASIDPFIRVLTNIIDVNGKEFNHFIGELTNKIKKFTSSAIDMNVISLRFGDGLKSVANIFKNLFTIAGKFAPLLKPIAEFIAIKSLVVLSFIEKLTGALAKSDFNGFIIRLGEFIQSIFDLVDISDLANKALDKMSEAFDKITEAARGFLNKIAELLGTKDGWARLFNIGGLILVLEALKQFPKFLRSLRDNIKIWKKKILGRLLGDGVAGGIYSFKRALDELKDTFVEMQNSLKAHQLLTIAVAIGVLAGSMFLLSTIKPEDMAKATLAMGVLISGLYNITYELKTLLKDITPTQIGAFMAVAHFLVSLSIAVAILSIAVNSLGNNSLEELAKGLGGVLVLLGSLTGVAFALTKMGALSMGGKQIIAVSIGLIGMAYAIKIMASAVGELGSYNDERLMNGLMSIWLIMGSMVIAMKKMTGVFTILSGGQLLGIALALISMSFAIKLLADAVGEIGKIKPEQLVMGLFGVLTLVGGLMVALNSMAKMADKRMWMASGSLTLMSVGLIAMAVAINLLVSATKALGEEDPEKLVMGLFGMLSIIFSLSSVMSKGNPIKMAAFGLSMIPFAIAINMLASALTMFSGININTLIVGISAISAFLAVAMAIVSAVSPAKIVATSVGLIGISTGLKMLTSVIKELGDMDMASLYTGIGGVAAMLIGIGLAATLLKGAIIPMLALGVALNVVGAGLLLFTAGLSALLALMGTVIATVGSMGSAIAMSFGEMLKGITAMASLVGAAFGSLIVGALKGIGSKAKEIGSAFLQMLIDTIKMAKEKVPIMAEEFMSMMTSIIDAVRTRATELVTKFLGLIGDIIQGVINGIAPIIELIVGLIIVIVNKVAETIEAHKEEIANAVINIAESILDVLMSTVFKIPALALRLITALGKGIASGVKIVKEKAGQVAQAIISKIDEKTGGLLSAGIKYMTNLKNGIVKGVSSVISYASQIPGKIVKAISGKVSEFRSVGRHAIQGFINGFNSISAASVATRLGSSVLTALKHKLGIHSPSREFAKIGKFAVQGFSNGIKNTTRSLVDTVKETGGETLDAMQQAMNGAYDTLSEGIDDDPSITPVLDLSSIQNGLGSLDAMMSSKKAMAINATLRNTKSTTELITEAVKEGLDSMGDTITSGIQNGAKYEFDISIPIDGREVARTTAVYTQDELNKLTDRTNRALGMI